MIQTLDPETVTTVAERYRQRGYEVLSDPDPSLLPNEAKSLQPDFLATKGDEHVIVEVKYPQKLLAYPALMQLADVIRRIPGWRLDVVVLERPKEYAEPEPLSVENATRRLQSADFVANETADYAAALLLVWTAIEAILSDQVRKQTEEFHIGTARLPKLAYSLGLIDSEDFTTAEWMTKIRNDVVHGGSELSVSRLDYDKARNFALRLINGDPESERLAS